MITRIEISGFKGFSKLDLSLTPFSVIAGVNGVGKSNLFDALRHLAALAGDNTLRETFVTERGSYDELFTTHADGTVEKSISYGVEMLLPKTVTDEFSASADLQHLRLRYELTVDRTSEFDYSIRHERLTYITKKSDSFIKRYKQVAEFLPKLGRARQTPFIDTESDRITLSQDGNQGRKREYSLSGALRTVLSSITTVEFPHAFAAKKLFEGIRFLQLNPEQLRRPSRFSDERTLRSDGAFLAAMLSRLTENDPFVAEFISDDLAATIPSVKGVELVRDEEEKRYIVTVRHVDGYAIPSNLLSDGTLRILALIAISYDPEFDGIIVLEEPENGVHPGRLGSIAGLLQDIGVDITDQEEMQRRSRLPQVVTNTHSPVFIGHVPEESLYAALPKKVRIGDSAVETVTEIKPVVSPHGDLFSIAAKSELIRMLHATPKTPLVASAV